MNTPSMLHHYQDTNTQNFIQTREKRGGKPLLDQLQGEQSVVYYLQGDSLFTYKLPLLKS